MDFSRLQFVAGVLLCAIFQLGLISPNMKASSGWKDRSGKEELLEQENEIAFRRHEIDSLLQRYRGRIIRNIRFEVRDVFSAPVYRPENRSPLWYGKIGNLLHPNTRSWVVREKLLFSEGDTLDLFLLRDSERLLRESGLFVDALIYPAPVQGNASLVDLIVVTQDRWTMILPASYNPEEKSGFVSLKEQNFIGLGHQLEGRVDFSHRGLSENNFSWFYHAQNLFGSYIDGEANSFVEDHEKTREIKFERPFFSTAVHWAGGLQLQWKQKEDRFFARQEIPLSWQQHRFWLGRAIGFWFGDLNFRQKSQLVASASFSSLSFRQRPEVASHLMQKYHNSNLVLASLGFVYRDYYQDYFLNRFGVTEDVPIGILCSALAGIEMFEFDQRYYFGLNVGAAERQLSLGYVSAGLALGGFYTNRSWEQGTIKNVIRYHTPLFRMNDWSFRVFARWYALLGVNRFPGELLFLDDQCGMRGFTNSRLVGTKRALLTIDANIFSPYRIFGFILAGNLFADFGSIGYSWRELKHNPVYQTFGIGLRVRNESLSMNTAQIALTFSPNMPGGKGSFGILFTSNLFEFDNFSFSRPEVLAFER